MMTEPHDALKQSATDPRWPGRRRAERFPMDAAVELVAPEGGHGVVRDASGTGVQVAIDRPLQPGARYTLVMRTPHGAEHHDEVRVVWTRPRGAGCIAGLAFVE